MNVHIAPWKITIVAAGNYISYINGSPLYDMVELENPGTISNTDTEELTAHEEQGHGNLLFPFTNSRKRYICMRVQKNEQIFAYIYLEHCSARSGRFSCYCETSDFMFTGCSLEISQVRLIEDLYLPTSSHAPSEGNFKPKYRWVSSRF